MNEVSFPKDFSTAAERLERLCALALRDDQAGVGKAFVTEGIYIVARLTFGAIRDLAYSGAVFAKNMVVLEVNRAFLDASKHLSSAKAGFIWAIYMTALLVIGPFDSKAAIVYSYAIVAVEQLGEGTWNRTKQAGRLSVLTFGEVALLFKGYLHRK